MTTITLLSSSFLPFSSSSFQSSRRSLSFSSTTKTTVSLKPLSLRASLPSSSSFDDDHTSKKREKSILSKLIHEIEPMDVSLIQKDVPPATIDAMKRTISGMLGLLPSDHFQVLIDSLWDPLSKLLVSSMMTGYTLRNAEFRFCLEKSFDLESGNREVDVNGMLIEGSGVIELSSEDKSLSESEKVAEEPSEDVEDHGVGGCEMSPEAHEYVRQLQSRLSSVRKELDEVKRKTAALQMQQLAGEEKTDLLDYLRSLQPEKVAELSEPTSPELKETIHSIVHGLLATLSPKMHSKVPPLLSENAPTGAGLGEDGDYAEIVENTSLQFQPLISLSRDYLARLLFWCMLLGHYLKGLEYRTELTELLSLTPNTESSSSDGKQAA